MNDKQQIEICVQIYINSMEQSDPNLVKQAFHPNGSVVGYLHGELMEMSVHDFAEFVASQQPSPRESVNIHSNQHTAPALTPDKMIPAL